MPRLLRFLGASVTSTETLARVMKTPCSPISRYFGSNLRFLSIKEFDFVVRAAGDMVSRYGWVSCVLLAVPLTVRLLRRLAAVRWALLLTLCPPHCATSCCPVGIAGRPLSASVIDVRALLAVSSALRATSLNNLSTTECRTHLCLLFSVGGRGRRWYLLVVHTACPCQPLRPLSSFEAPPPPLRHPLCVYVCLLLTVGLSSQVWAPATAVP